MANTDWLGNQSKALEDQFFLKEDRVLIEKLQRMKKMQESKAALKEVSGITNEHLLDRLVELGIHPETLAALSLVPLIETAWADGDVDEMERDAVLKAAEAKGLKTGGIEHELLERWLMNKPPTELLSAWTQYIRGLSEKMDLRQKALLRDELIDRARNVAEASGGVLGIGKISKSESAMLEKLSSVFG